MNGLIVFDLDDTLVPEIAYLESAFAEIAARLDASNAELYTQMLDGYHGKQDVFAQLCVQYPHVNKEALRDWYRNHIPDFSAFSHIRPWLTGLKNRGFELALITDGYAVTQRNKIRALGIEDLMQTIVISEEFGSTKPELRNFEACHQPHIETYYYVADNVKKDFKGPNELGWITVCLLDSGRNIHPQDFHQESLYLPAHRVASLPELEVLL